MTKAPTRLEFPAVNSELQLHDDAAQSEVSKSGEHTNLMIQPTTPEKTPERKPSCWKKVANHPERPANDRKMVLTIEIDVERSSERLGLGYKAPETSSTPARSWDEQDHLQHGLIHIPTNCWRAMGHQRALRLQYLRIHYLPREAGHSAQNLRNPKDDTSTPRSDGAVSKIFTDLKQNTEKMDCTDLKAQVVESNPEVIRKMAERKETWAGEADEVYHNWYFKTQASDYIHALHATYILATN